MALDITGKIIHILPEAGGQTKAGKPWSKQEFVIETEEQYPKKVCISLMGEKVQELKKFSIGQQVKASLNIESREYNGRWYSDIRAWRLEAAGSTQPQSNYAPPANTPADSFSSNPLPAATDDDLPF
ncbi:MAG: DUF3127 domain-containing protein [Bacteroidia bacterium]|nr:DUF3127 domain-containing protein [Bacteroidia bacterium]HQV01541.1 DUF3127 domain-containing protein [Bacteroidia bacterium]